MNAAVASVLALPIDETQSVRSLQELHRRIPDGFFEKKAGA